MVVYCNRECICEQQSMTYGLYSWNQLCIYFVPSGNAAGGGPQCISGLQTVRGAGSAASDLMCNVCEERCELTAPPPLGAPEKHVLGVPRAGVSVW